MGRDEGKKALWAMMESVRGTGLAMLNEDKGIDGTDTGVYFDGKSNNVSDIEFAQLLVVLGRAMVAFSLKSMFVTQVLLLIFGPLTVLGGLAWVLILSKRNPSMPTAGSNWFLWADSQ